jgi:hypothetical protein
MAFDALEESMESFAFWYYCLVVFPLALEALAGPIVMKRYGMRVMLPALVALWLAPVLVIYYVLAVPEILIWILPISNKELNPALEALICYTLPIWLSFAAMWGAARLKQSLLVQSIVGAVSSAAMLALVSPPFQTWALQNLLNRH